MKQNDFYELDGCTDFIPVKLIEEHKHMTNPLKVELTETGHRTFVPHIYSFPKVNEPQKPIVPKFVVDWVDNTREYNLDFDDWLDYENQPPIVYCWLNSENKRQAELNTLALVTLIVNGANAVEIEQEKLYTVEIPDPHGMYKIRYLFRNSVGNIRIGGTDYRDIFLEVETHLTESEIKQDFEWAFQFAKEVE